MKAKRKKSIKVPLLLKKQKKEKNSLPLAFRSFFPVAAFQITFFVPIFLPNDLSNLQNDILISLSRSFQQ